MKASRACFVAAVAAFLSLLFLASHPAAASVSVTHTEGNVLALYLDEGSGADVYDSSSNHGTVSGAVQGATWTTGVLGNALSFDAGSDYAAIPDSPACLATPLRP